MSKKRVHLVVDLRDAREIERLKEALVAKDEEILKLRADVRRLEYQVRFECILNLQLTDWLQEKGIKYPARLRNPKPIDTSF